MHFHFLVMIREKIWWSDHDDVDADAAAVDDADVDDDENDVGVAECSAGLDS